MAKIKDYSIQIDNWYEQYKEDEDRMKDLMFRIFQIHSELSTMNDRVSRIDEKKTQR